MMILVFAIVSRVDVGCDCQVILVCTMNGSCPRSVNHHCDKQDSSHAKHRGADPQFYIVFVSHLLVVINKKLHVPTNKFILGRNRRLRIHQVKDLFSLEALDCVDSLEVVAGGRINGSYRCGDH